MIPARQELVRLALEAPEDALAQLVTAMTLPCTALRRRQSQGRRDHLRMLRSLLRLYEVSAGVDDETKNNLISVVAGLTMRAEENSNSRIAALSKPGPSPEPGGNVVALFPAGRTGGGDPGPSAA